jgi:hypothetical protein
MGVDRKHPIPETLERLYHRLPSLELLHPCGCIVADWTLSCTCGVLWTANRVPIVAQLRAVQQEQADVNYN